MADVFISYRRQDLAEAERLSRELAAAGHKVWHDEWQIGIGDSIVAEVQKGLECSTYLVLCYSSSGVMSPWMTREWMSALARQLEGHHVKILPARLTGGDPPVILQDIKYADLVLDWNGGVRAILAAVR
jgi:hypothetical protein